MKVSSDGFAITSLILAFFAYHYPDIIRAGKLYKCFAPLYKLDKAERKFVLNKHEFIEEFNKNISNNIILERKGKSLKRGDMEDFLYVNKNYLETLQKISSHFRTDPDVIEFIAYHLVHETKDFNKLLRKRFKELSIDRNVLTGVVNGKYQFVVIDELFTNQLKPLMTMISANDNSEIEYNVKEKVGKEYKDLGKMTVGQILSYCEKYTPVIRQRYKGLGELKASDLKETALDPHNRTLYRITMDDAEKVLKEFDIFHGDDVQGRKDRFTGIYIDPDILDN